MQRLVVSGFLGITEADISLNGLTVLIGPQASGKSVIARLIFFCIEYFADFDEIPLMKNEHKKTYDSRKRDAFTKLFPTYSWIDDDFVIHYANNFHALTIRSKKGSASVELTTSESVATSFRQLKKSFQDFAKNLPEDTIASPTRVMREFRSQRDLFSNDLQRHHALFVPAARSFYATLREEIFSILSIDEKIDQIIMQFGEFYEGAKFRISYDQERFGGPGKKLPREAHYLRFFDPIIRGRYSKVDGRDWIVMDRGRVEMSKASSGQQEALPLLCALSQFPQPGRTLIIEEPEAHLFPTSQVKILEFIVEQAMQRSTDMFITTHSPYILSALNNFILKGSRDDSSGIPPWKVSAYSLVDGQSMDIFDSETNLVSGDYIDSVSEDIANEFARILMEDHDK